MPCWVAATMPTGFCTSRGCSEEQAQASRAIQPCWGGGYHACRLLPRTGRAHSEKTVQTGKGHCLAGWLQPCPKASGRPEKAVKLARKTCGCRQERHRANQGAVYQRQPCQQACAWTEHKIRLQRERAGFAGPAGWPPPCCLSKVIAQGKKPLPRRVAGKLAYTPVRWHLAADTCMKQHSRLILKNSSCGALDNHMGCKCRLEETPCWGVQL